MLAKSSEGRVSESPGKVLESTRRTTGRWAKDPTWASQVAITHPRNPVGDDGGPSSGGYNSHVSGLCDDDQLGMHI